MSYPDYPNNRLIVNGVDLTEKFKMVLADGYTLAPPSPKTYTVDIPGGNGKLDLTEFLIGDTVYDNREQTFTFYIIGTNEFEKVKTEVSNFLHGKAFDYKITMDPEYTYHGRFKISEYNHNKYTNGIVGAIKISITADPYKLKPIQNFNVNAVGGTIVHLNSGRMKVCPTIKTEGLVKVIYNGKLIALQQGTWTINDIILIEGLNDIYINSYDVHNFTWGDLKKNSITWGGFKEKRLFEWYKSNGDNIYTMMTWAEVNDKTWNDLSIQKWSDLVYVSDLPHDIKDVLIQYEWGDL